jgi:hypothetical protein
MKRWLAATLSAVAIASLAAQEDAPLPEDPEGLEIEPPVLIHSRDQNGLPVVAATPARPDVARLEADLARAKRGAASADRLYKAGIIAKVEAEDRVLRVVRLEAQLADARLDAAKNKAEERNDEEVAQAEEAARRSAEERHRAELEAALRNLQRQQKLLALGSGRKADVSRAEKKLAELQQTASR